MVRGLLETYCAWGLPLPPKQARLVLFDYGWTQDARGVDTPFSQLAFLVNPDSKDQPLLLVGTIEYRPENEDVKPRPVDAEKVDAKTVFELNVGLATALQCEAQGYHRLASELLTVSLGQSSGHPYSAFLQPANLPPKMALAFTAWAHWGNQLILPNSDRSVIARRMQDLLGVEPKLKTKPNSALVEDLKAALVPRQTEPGSTESLIDDLLELAYKPPSGDDRSPAPQFQKLALLGFKAVPNLIEHLDDRRLTRTVRLGFNNFPPYHLRVGDIVSDLLQGLAGDDLGKDWLRRQQGYTLDKTPVRAWWAKAQEVGEENYLVNHLLPDKQGSDFPNQQMLDILVKEYSFRLPAVYRALLDDKPTLQSWPLARAVGASSVPREQKMSLFLYAATNQNLEHRRAALWELRKLDEERFVSILVDNLNAMPPTPKEPYWRSREAGLANLVMETDDARAWKALLAAARRADVGLRMELMNPMYYTYIGQRQRKQRLEFVAAFLDDATVRDEKSDPTLFEGPYAGFTFPKMEVRNFAAMQIACILHLSEDPKPGWTSKEWTALREKVRANLRREQSGE